LNMWRNMLNDANPKKELLENLRKLLQVIANALAGQRGPQAEVAE
ncbi:11180_t:CDS:2, partial [Gigaspora rosea]